MRSITKQISRYHIFYAVFCGIMNTLLKLLRMIMLSKNKSGGSIVIVALHKLGDAVFTIPAIKQIIYNYEKEIVIVCYPETVPIYETVLTNVYYYKIEHSNFHFNDRYADRKARKLLSSQNPEIIYDLTGVMTSATLIFNSRAREINGMNREHFKSIYDNYCEIRQKPNLIDKYMDIASLNIELKKQKSDIAVPRKNIHTGPVLIHPFAGWKAKEWSLNKFIKLSLKLKNEYDIRLITKQSDISEEVRKEIEYYGIDLIQTKTINDLITNIKECSIFIGNDSGPVYIASLLGKATFTIFGPTNPEFSLSSGEHHRHIAKTLKCSPEKNTQYCFTNAGQNGCPAFECMNQIQIDEVYYNLAIFLSEQNVT